MNRTGSGASAAQGRFLCQLTPRLTKTRDGSYTPMYGDLVNTAADSPSQAHR
jgi:hypothetical protein